MKLLAVLAGCLLVSAVSACPESLAGTAGGYHFAKRPVVVAEHDESGYFYVVYLRLNRAIPERQRHPLGHAYIGPAGGSTGLSHVAPRSQLNPRAHCYMQIIDNDLDYPPELQHPRPGTPVKVTIAIARDRLDRRHYFFSLRLRLQRVRHRADPERLARAMGCLA